MSKIEIIKNKYYDEANPLVTICTPVFNRKHTIERTLKSIKSQTFKNFEYIIVDDGSTDGVEVLIEKFMNENHIPVLFIRKSNGGVHTARNLATKYARGKFLINIDSDDELLPKALEILVDAWKNIPEEKQNEYRDVVALCVDENNKIVGKKFPYNINDVDTNVAHKMCYDTHGEHIGIDNTSIRKENLFPEPKGVKFVEENILWQKLDTKYKTYYINEPVRIYHTEGNDHLTTKKKKNIQALVNMLYNNSVYLNDYRIYLNSFKRKIKSIIKYLISKNIILKTNTKVYFDYKIVSSRMKALIIFLYVPCLIFTNIYIKKYCELDLN